MDLMFKSDGVKLSSNGGIIAARDPLNYFFGFAAAFNEYRDFDRLIFTNRFNGVEWIVYGDPIAVS